ncbi:IclR family transcriptional regulator [Rhodococcus spelaei]|uniref:IclR family transcriptional regulator n=1 Tax=Rhodococcus spelaei TaxID=2546320 RepID=A0A541BQC6_9NOCA|nr:IclR family transcriptional regulator [Rhodococcus spelaei]TQF74547.1 IclR family transcriptional regulator [Rhodococcus spelaei]
MTVITEAPARSDKREVPPSMVERMTLILDAFDGRAARLTLEEVAGRSRLPRSTVHRILDSLVKLNWVEHAAFGYRLGRRALGVGGDGGHAEVREAAAPLLHDLHMQTGMVVHLSVLDGHEVIYLDKVGGRLASSIPSRVGGRVPAQSTAAGKAMLAWLDPERIDALFGTRPNRCTERTITDLGTLHLELNRIRQRRGLAFEREESARGVACVGAAVRGHEGPVAAVSLCGDVRTAQLERVAPLVVDAAREIGRTLFPELGNARRASQPVTPVLDTWSPEARSRLAALGQTSGWI